MIEIIDEFRGIRLVKIIQQGETIYRVLGPRGGILAFTSSYAVAQDRFSEEINRKGSSAR